MADLAKLGMIVDSSSARRASRDLSKLRRGSARTEKSVDRLSKTARRMGRFLKRAAIVGGAALIGLSGTATKFAAEFETLQTKIHTLVGVSTSTLQRFEKELLDMSQVVGKVPAELSRALFVITSAGERGAGAMDILEASAKASAIGLGETSEIARTATAAITAYGEENLSAALAVDQMTAIVREGNLEAEALAGSVGRVIGPAQQLGISFAEIGASIATFTRLGVGAEQATTGLLGVMNAIIKRTDQGEKALAAVGMSYADLRKEIRERGLANTMIHMIELFDGNIDAISSLIPNVRGLSSVLGTAGAQSESYIKILENIENALGIVDEGFEDTAKTAGFMYNQIKAFIQVIAIEIGNELLPMIKEWIETNKALIKTKITEWATGFANTVKTLVGFVSRYGDIIGKLFVVGTITALLTPIAQLIVQLKTLQTVMGVTGLLGLIGTGAIVPVAIAALVTLIGVDLYSAWKKTQEAQEAFQKSLDDIRGSAEDVKGVLDLLTETELEKEQTRLQGAIAETRNQIRLWDNGKFFEFHEAVDLAELGASNLKEAVEILRAQYASYMTQLENARIKQNELSTETGVTKNEVEDLAKKYQGLADMGDIQVSIDIESGEPVPMEMQEFVPVDLDKLPSEMDREEHLAFLQHVQTQTQATQQVFTQLAGTMTSAFANGQSAADAFLNSLKALAAQAAALAVAYAAIQMIPTIGTSASLGQFLMNQLFGFEFGGNRRHGGDIDRDKWYIVGEEGPEILTSDYSGRIDPITEASVTKPRTQSITRGQNQRSRQNDAVNNLPLTAIAQKLDSLISETRNTAIIIEPKFDGDKFIEWEIEKRQDRDNRRRSTWRNLE